VDFIGFFWFFLVFIFGTQPVLVLSIAFAPASSLGTPSASRRMAGRYVRRVLVVCVLFAVMFVVFSVG
jgi:hypothetical protein